MKFSSSKDGTARVTTRAVHRLDREELAGILAWITERYDEKITEDIPAKRIREMIRDHLTAYGTSEMMDLPEPQPEHYAAIDRAIP